ncbi:HAMP domain-containing sensor histidine kinase [Amycolatopsis magusensis]
MRFRLTLLYSALFLVSGAVLLLIVYLLLAGGLPVVRIHGPGFVGDLGTICARRDGVPALGDELAACADQARTLLEAQRAGTLRQFLLQAGAALASMTIVSVGLGWLVAGRVLRPLRVITTAARRISASDLHQRLAMTGKRDELTELGDTFDELLGRLDAAFTAQRQFVANASHELRTPLARQRTVLEVALTDPAATVSGLQVVCRRVLAAGEQQERLIEALLTLARSERGLDRREPVDLRAIVDAVVSARDAAGRDVRVCLGPAIALGDARLVEQLVVNLVDNAIRHNVEGGSVEVRTRAGEGVATLTVANTGTAIPLDQIDQLFEPFTRLAGERTATGDGLGLGLPIVAAVVAAHNGHLDARPRPGGGLNVTVELSHATNS